jgi:YggT family protein
MSTAIQIIRIFLEVLSFFIFVRVILSWFIMSTRNRVVITIYQVFHQITEPILGPLHRIIPNIGMIDITPVVAIILLYIIDMVLANTFQ